MTIRSVAAALLLISGAANAASDCASLITGHAAQQPTMLALPGLDYVGAEHSNDPAAPQFAEIERHWNAFKPTIAFYEGPNRPIPSTRDEVIRQTGESGFVRFLAQRDKVTLGRLEPAPQDEVAYVAQLFPLDQVALFYTLREAARQRERMKLAPDAIVRNTEAMLSHFPKIGSQDNPLRSAADVAAAYQRYWKQPANWWDAPQAWFDPAQASSATGGIFTNEVNAASSRFRDLNMVDKLSAALASGQRAFAVVGKNHVAAQAAALKCAISPTA